MPVPKKKPLNQFGSPLPLGASRTFEDPGYVPDYASLLANDPEVLAGMAGMHGADIADEAALNETLAAAQRAYTGGVTDLGRQLSRGTAQGDVDLGARGTLASGALAVLRGSLNEAYTRSLNQLGEQRANTERSARQSLASNQAARQMQQMMLEAAARNRLAADPRYQPVPGSSQTAKWNPITNMYHADDGSMYTQGGELVGQGSAPNWGVINSILGSYTAKPGPVNRKLPVPKAPSIFTKGWGG